MSWQGLTNKRKVALANQRSSPQRVAQISESDLTEIVAFSRFLSFCPLLRRRRCWMPMMSSDRDVTDKAHIVTRVSPVKARKPGSFEKVSESIWVLTSLSDIRLVLKDPAEVLNYLYACEWMHRNISIGGIYSYFGHSLLGDLKDAKRKGSDDSRIVLTGTLDFMAVEVLLQEYAFIPENLERIDVILDALARTDAREEEEEEVEIPDFRHNYAHDVESLWWLALSVLFFNAIKPKSEAGVQSETDDYLHGQEEYARRIFPKRVSDIAGREMFFRNRKEFGKGISWFPKAVAGLKRQLRLMREALVGLYDKFEAQLSREDYGKFAGLYDAFIGGFEKCQKLTLHIELESSRRIKKDKPKEAPNSPPERSVQVPKLLVQGGPIFLSFVCTTKMEVGRNVRTRRQDFIAFVFNLVFDALECLRERESRVTAILPGEDVIDEAHILTRVFLVKKRKVRSFEEVSKLIRILANLSDVLLGLKECAEALEYLHQCNWIHRINSAGNVYFYNGRGLLGDLECAKRMGSDGSHDLLTGTMDFMAVEVLLRGYAFLPSPAERQGIDVIMDDLEMEDSQRQPINIPDFLHNYVHDVESLWWLALFVLFLFFNVIKPKPEAGVQLETAYYLHDQEKYGRRIFPDRVSDIRDREMFFRNEKEFSNSLSWFPKAIAGLLTPLGLMRDALIAMYTMGDALFPQADHGQFARLHNGFIKCLERCRKVALRIELEALRKRDKPKGTLASAAACDS